MKNGFLVRLWGMIDDKNLLLKSYETNNITETLKLFDYMEKNDIPIINKAETNSIYPQYDNEEYYIYDITFNFGGHETVPCLDVWVEL